MITVNDAQKQDTSGRKWSEAAQQFYAWLMSQDELPEVMNSDWLGKQSFEGKKLTKDKRVTLVHELVTESLAQLVEEDKSFKLI
ncbi:MAG: hypothetical protein PUP91_34730 [Rhizonema sp. PD37]|nr:hypothetical protein [Rhizonema sp. PD37]